MISRFTSSERAFSAHTAPRWLAPFMVASVIGGAAVYGLIEVTQAPRAIEAPGFLTPVGDGQMEIAAYVPPTHPEYAINGARATVIFPDGSERVAKIASGDAGAPALPHAEMLGDAQLGTLVRMEFDDARPATGGTMVEGLP